MLELKNISKVYITEAFKQNALDGVSIKFRKNELPKVGDIVIVGHLLTKNRNSFRPIDAKIIRIVKRKEE